MLSAGLVVGIGSNTVAPDTELSAKERLSKQREQSYTQSFNPHSDRVTLTGESQPKIKPPSSGKMAAYEGDTSLLQNTISKHNWFPSNHLSDTTEITPVFFGSTRNHNSTPTVAGSFGGSFSSNQDYSVSGSNYSLPTAISTLSTLSPGLPFNLNNSSKSSSETIKREEPVPTPEPSTLVILGSGLAILYYKILRRR